MIVVDENLHGRLFMRAIAAWYQGQVVSITALRPGTVIKDDAIPALWVISATHSINKKPDGFPKTRQV
jgi:hypothetical protein